MKTKEAILNSASELIRSGGYFGTGINQIISNIQVPKGSLYHHFPGGKDEIIELALERVVVTMSVKFKNTMKGKLSAAHGLKAIVDLFIEDFKRDNFKYGCPIAAVSTDVSSSNENLRVTCLKMFDYWTDSLVSYLIHKGVEEKTKEKAERFLILLEGAILLSRVQQSDHALQLIKKDIDNLIQ